MPGHEDDEDDFWPNISSGTHSRLIPRTVSLLIVRRRRAIILRGPAAAAAATFLRELLLKVLQTPN